MIPRVVGSKAAHANQNVSTWRVQRAAGERTRDRVSMFYDAGAKVLQPLENKFYGDRAGTVADPFGHQWTIGTHVEDVAPEDLEKRAAEAFAKMAAKQHS